MKKYSLVFVVIILCLIVFYSGGQGQNNSPTFSMNSRTLRQQKMGFKTDTFGHRNPLAIGPDLSWNTFLGGSNNDYGGQIAVDSNGNVYIVGISTSSWGSPVRPYNSGEDVFVAKLDFKGELQWNTFLGGSSNDENGHIAIDKDGNIYITGKSNITWGSPIRPFAGGTSDAFIAKLNGNGSLLWNTFLGGTSWDVGTGLALDAIGNVFVTGETNGTWGNPIRSFEGADAFVAKLDGNGVLQWNTFLGGAAIDDGWDICIDIHGNVYVTGASYSTWGSPAMPFSGSLQSFIAKLSGEGILLWNTFFGDEPSYAIAVDASENTYVTGESTKNWGTPIRQYTGDADAFAAKINSTGIVQWNTFLGGNDMDCGDGIAMDMSGNIYLSGYSLAAWGSPDHPFSGNENAFLVKLNGNGTLQWSTFLEAYSGAGCAIDIAGNIYITGSSDKTWGSPVRPFSVRSDCFVAKFGDSPIGAGVYPPLNFSLQRLQNNLIFFKEYINRLTWTKNPANTRNITNYRIYCKVSSAPDSEFDLLVELPASVFSYDDRGLKKDSAYTYRITSVDESGNESGWAVVGN